MINKIKTIVFGMVVCLIVSIMIIGMFGLAALQTSYRNNPPSVQERAEHPVLIKFLIGE